MNSAKVKKLTTAKGDVEVSIMDGYRVLYKNDKNIPFVNLKVELSKNDSYQNDKLNLIEHLKYLNAHSQNMETKDLIELEFNDYKVFGFRRSTLATGNIFGTFVMFPGNDVIVYFYFNNVKPENRNLISLENYKKECDQFMDEYTKHLKTCEN